VKISVVVPVYNVPKPLLDECLDALAKQTLRPAEFEIILVDDQSSDPETIATVDAFKLANAKVVRHAENLGLNETRHSGVKAATGDYIIFVDGDDVLTRDALESLRMAAAPSNADIVTASLFRWIHDNKTYADQPFFAKAFPDDYLSRLKASLSVKHSFTMCARLFRRSILTSDVFSLPKKTLHEDMTTFVRALFKAEIVKHINRSIYYYTINPGSITSRFGREHVEGIFFAFHDWIKNAKDRNLFDELQSSIAAGTEVLTNRCVEHCILSEDLPFESKVEILRDISERYRKLPVATQSATLKGTKFLAWFEASAAPKDEARIKIGIEKVLDGKKTTPINGKSILDKGLNPTEAALRFSGKIAFVCQVDYQLRNAARLSRELHKRGYACVVLDNSAFASGGLRQLPSSEMDIFAHAEYIKVKSGPYPPDWLCTARLVLTFNDFNDDFREALEYRHRLGMPSVCIVEGINDFLRVDFEGYRYLPYRRCDYVFLAGEHDAVYFEDRKNAVVGLAAMETFHCKDVKFPDKPIAILNVNFTYGALENKRDIYVDEARQAFDLLGIDWRITQHPMDTGELKDLPVSEQTQYELIDGGSVFISRFATGILEALASGKPVVYFNPHGEKVDKFTEPMGAFEVARNASELAEAIKSTLRDISGGVDFRQRAAKFLEFHTAYNATGMSVTSRFADAVAAVLAESHAATERVADLLLLRSRANAQDSGDSQDGSENTEETKRIDEKKFKFKDARHEIKAKIRHLWRHSPGLILAILGCVFIASAVVLEAGRPWRIGLGLAALVFVLVGFGGVVAKRALRRKLAKFEERIASRYRSQKAADDTNVSQAEHRIVLQHAAHTKEIATKIGVLEEGVHAQLKKLQDQLAFNETQLNSIKSKADTSHIISIVRDALDEKIQAPLKSLEGRVIATEAELKSVKSQADLSNIVSRVSDALEEKLQAPLKKLEKRLVANEGELSSVRSQAVAADIVSVLRASTHLTRKQRSLDSAGGHLDVEHGHALLMTVLADLEERQPGCLEDAFLIEIGTTRERSPAQGSTEKLAIFAALRGMKFISVDVDPNNTKRASEILRYLNPSAQAVTARGESYLERTEAPFDFVYLDAFDFDHGKHSQQRQDRYRELLQTNINDQDCWRMHEACALAIKAKMRVGGIVVIDDTWTDADGMYLGKGKLAVPLLLDSGFEIIAKTRMTIALRRKQIKKDVGAMELESASSTA